MLLDDPQLGGRRMELVTNAAKKLASCGMINFNERTEDLVIADLGLIAAKYYIRYASIEIYNEVSVCSTTCIAPANRCNCKDVQA
jgi:antiviral helicase SLH1